jgi:O-antigen ligase
MNDSLGLVAPTAKDHVSVALSVDHTLSSENYRRQVPHYLLASCLVLLPVTATWSSLTGHDFARVAQVALGAACALWLLSAEQAQTQWRKGFWAPALLLFGLAVASTLSAPHPGAAMRELSLFVGMITIACACARALKPSGLVRIAVVSSATYSVIVAVVCLLNVATGDAPQDHRHLFVGYDNYRFFNHVQAVTLPLLAAGTVSALAHVRWVKLAWFAHTTGWILLFFTMGRGTLLGLGVGVAFVWLLHRSRAREYIRNVLVGAVIGAATKAVLAGWLPSWSDVVPSLGLTGQLAATGSAQSRFGLWGLAGDYIGESPWLGIGPMHYANRPNLEAAHPHNIYLQVAAEWGIPMLVGLLSASLFGLWALRRAVSARQSPKDVIEGAALLMACTAVAVDGTFSGNFVMPMSQLWIAVLVGTAAGWTLNRQPQYFKVDQRRITTSWDRLVLRSVIGMALALQVWLCVSVWPELADLNAHLLSTSAMDIKSTRLSPRFWSDGWF